MPRPRAARDSDRCPSPPRPTTDGCVISGRLSRLTASGGVMSGPEHVIIEDWCQQFPSHSAGNLMFGPEGALFVSGGNDLTNPDYGQLGGTVAGTPTPSNPCGSRRAAACSRRPARRVKPFAQDLRTGGDPVTLDGALLRIDPNTGLGWSTNALAGQGRRERPADHRPRVSEPVPVHDPAGNVGGLDRRRSGSPPGRRSTACPIRSNWPCSSGLLLRSGCVLFPSLHILRPCPANPRQVSPKRRRQCSCRTDRRVREI